MPWYRCLRECTTWSPKDTGQRHLESPADLLTRWEKEALVGPACASASSTLCECFVQPVRVLRLPAPLGRRFSSWVASASRAFGQSHILSRRDLPVDPISLALLFLFPSFLWDRHSSVAYRHLRIEDRLFCPLLRAAVLHVWAASTPSPDLIAIVAAEALFLLADAVVELAWVYLSQSISV
jgi:hypothetical protein